MDEEKNHSAWEECIGLFFSFATTLIHGIGKWMIPALIARVSSDARRQWPSDLRLWTEQQGFINRMIVGGRKQRGGEEALINDPAVIPGRQTIRSSRIHIKKIYQPSSD